MQVKNLEQSMTQGVEHAEAHTQVKTVLIVEDDIHIGEVLVQAIVQETPFIAILAQSGDEALNLVKNIKPSLFILDYQLPRMNGIELYDILQTNADLAQLPAIMISAQLPVKELQKRNIKGMNKPLDLDDFLQTIEQFLA
jgi:DNA-binding NtrC family response regulator